MLFFGKIFDQSLVGIRHVLAQQFLRAPNIFFRTSHQQYPVLFLRLRLMMECLQVKTHVTFHIIMHRANQRQQLRPIGGQIQNFMEAPV